MYMYLALNDDLIPQRKSCTWCKSMFKRHIDYEQFVGLLIGVNSIFNNLPIIHKNYQTNLISTSRA